MAYRRNRQFALGGLGDGVLAGLSAGMDQSGGGLAVPLEGGGVRDESGCPRPTAGTVGGAGVAVGRFAPGA